MTRCQPHRDWHLFADLEECVLCSGGRQQFRVAAKRVVQGGPLDRAQVRGDGARGRGREADPGAHPEPRPGPRHPRLLRSALTPRPHDAAVVKVRHAPAAPGSASGSPIAGLLPQRQRKTKQLLDMLTAEEAAANSGRASPGALFADRRRERSSGQPLAAGEPGCCLGS